MPAVPNGRLVHSPTVSPNPGPGLSPAFHKANEATENVWLAIGKASETLGDMERALNAYERVLRTNPKALRALTQAAQICRHKEAYQRAIDYFNRAITLNSRDGEVWGSLGHCFLMQDDLGSAYTAYQQALFHLPHPKDDPKLWYGIGILYDRYGSLDHAEEAFQSVLRMDLNFEKADEIHFRLGIIYKQLQRYTDSLKCFNMILHHPPNPLTQMDIWFQIGHVHDQQKDYVRAKEAWERVLADSPDHAKVLQQLGWLYHQPSAPFCNQELAVQYLTKSIESDASDAQSWYLLGRAYMTSEKYNKAYEAYQQAVYRDGRNPTFWISIGVLYFQINQYKDALDAYTRAIRLNPYISEVWFDLGSLYESCNRQLQDAIDAYLRAKELDPNNQVVVERLDILRRYEKDPSINIPSPPLPRDVHPTAYASNQRGQEKKSIKRLAMPDGVNGGSAPPPPPPQPYGLEGRPGSRPASSSGRYRNSSMGPSRDEPRYGQGDIIMAEAQRERDRERERAYSNSSTVRPDSAPNHSHHPHGGQVLAPVINHPQQMPPPQAGGYRRSGNGRGGSRPRSMSPANYRPQNGSPLASVHSVAYGQHSSAAGGQYNSYAPTPTQGRYDRPRSPPGGSSARGGAYNLPPPSTVQRTPGSESNDMVWERDPRAYPPPPPLDTREFVDRPERSVRVKEEPRERSVRPGPGGPSVNGGPPGRSYTHERHPSDGYEPRNGGRPQPSPHGSYQYPGPYEWRGRGSPPPGQGPPPPQPSQPQRRYDPLQEDRAPPPSQYPPYPPQGPPGQPRHPGSHSPVPQSYDDRRIPPMSQGPPEPMPERGRRGRRSEKYEQPPPPPPLPQKEGTPGARRRNLPRKKDGRDSMVATPAPGQGPEENSNGSPSWRSNGPHDDYPRPGPPPTNRHPSDYNEAQRQGPPQPQHRPEQMSPPPSSAAARSMIDEDDYDEPGAADALMGLSKSRGSGGHPAFSSNGPRRSSPTPSQTNSNRKRRRSGSSMSTYEESRRGSGDPNVPEPERKKQRLDEEQVQSRPPAPAPSRQNTFPSIRTIDDLTNPSDAGKRQSPTSKSSKPNSHAENMKSPPVLPPMQQSPPRAGEPADVDMEGVESPTRLRASKTKSPLSPTSPARANGNSNGKTAPPLVSHSPSPSHSGSRAASVSGPA